MKPLSHRCDRRVHIALRGPSMQTPTLFASEPGTIAPPASGKSWSETPLSEVPLDQWVEQFHRDGFLFVQKMLSPEICGRLRDELDRAHVEQVGNGGNGPFRVIRRMFEFSPANLALF